MFDTLLIITLFLLASILVCLLTLRLSINIKHMSLFSFINDIKGFFEIPPPPPLLNLTKIPPPLPIYFYQPSKHPPPPPPPPPISRLIDTYE